MVRKSTNKRWTILKETKFRYSETYTYEEFREVPHRKYYVGQFLRMRWNCIFRKLFAKRNKSDRDKTVMDDARWTRNLFIRWNNAVSLSQVSTIRTRTKLYRRVVLNCTACIISQCLLSISMRSQLVTTSKRTTTICTSKRERLKVKPNGFEYVVHTYERTRSPEASGRTGRAPNANDNRWNRADVWTGIPVANGNARGKEFFARAPRFWLRTL